MKTISSNSRILSVLVLAGFCPPADAQNAARKGKVVSRLCISGNGSRQLHLKIKRDKSRGRSFRNSNEQKKINNKQRKKIVKIDLGENRTP